MLTAKVVISVTSTLAAAGVGGAITNSFITGERLSAVETKAAAMEKRVDSLDVTLTRTHEQSIRNGVLLEEIKERL